MQGYVVATLAVAFGCWGMNAEGAMVPGHGPIMTATISHLPSVAGIQLIADAAVDDTVDDAEVDADDDGPIGIRLNGGYCTSDPPKWKYVADEGVNYYEFCNHAAIPNYLKQDAHKKPGSGGGIGELRSKLIVPCSMYNGTDFLPPAVVTDFCND